MNLDIVFETLVKKLTSNLSSKRMSHSIGVSNSAVELAVQYGAKPDKARVAGLLHDCARELSSNTLLQLAEGFGILVNDIELVSPFLLHAPVGACLVRVEFGVTDEEILQAIQYHTTGRPDMSLLDKVIFLADYIEPNRSFPGVQHIRKLAFRDLDKAVLAVYDLTLQHIIDQGGLIHIASIQGRNAMVLHLKK